MTLYKTFIETLEKYLKKYFLHSLQFGRNQKLCDGYLNKNFYDFLKKINSAINTKIFDSFVFNTYAEFCMDFDRELHTNIYFKLNKIGKLNEKIMEDAIMEETKKHFDNYDTDTYNKLNLYFEKCKFVFEDLNTDMKFMFANELILFDNAMRDN